jgi:hypothetical protein
MGSVKRPKEGTVESVLYNAAGHRRCPVTMPGYHQDRHGTRVCAPADPPAVEEIIAVMRAAVDRPEGARPRALIVLLWRAGLRIRAALELAETGLDCARGAVIVRQGKGARRREVGMDRWAWSQPRVLARNPISASDRRVQLRDPRADRWTAVGPVSGAEAAAGDRRRGWRASPLRAAPICRPLVYADQARRDAQIAG